MDYKRNQTNKNLEQTFAFSEAVLLLTHVISYVKAIIFNAESSN